METTQLEPTPLRLSLWDLFVWTTLAALACTLWSIQNAAAGAFQVNPQQVIFFLPAAFAFATSGTALFFFARRRYRGVPIDFQPGHWLLCLTGTILLYHALAILVRSAILSQFPPGSTSAGKMSLLVGIGQDLGFQSVFLAAGFLLRVRPTWRWVLLMPCLMSTASMVCQALWLWADYYGYLFLVRAEIVIVVLGLLILLTIAAWDKATTRDRRDGLHWLGVATVVILNSPPILIRTYEAWFR